MATIITYNRAKLIKKFPFFLIGCCLLWLTACNAEQDTRETFNPNHYPQGIITLANSKEVITYVAKSPKKQAQGLSGVSEKDFKDNESMFFYYKNEAPRRFWMPDTYFNLDIFFLDDQLRVVDIERNMASHPGRSEPPKIPQTRTITCQHVLEIKSTSPLAREIKIGDQLTWKSENGSLDEIK